MTTKYAVQRWPGLESRRVRIGTLAVGDAGALTLMLTKPDAALEKMIHDLPDPLPLGPEGATIARDTPGFPAALRDYIERATDWGYVLLEEVTNK